jgi:hypothetical protein
VLALWLTLSLAAAEPLTLHVDPDVSEVMVTCGARIDKYKPREGRVVIPVAPTSTCDVALTRKVGTVAGPGSVRCGSQGCERTVAGKQLGDVEPGVISILLAPETPARSLELDCEDDNRQRVDIVNDAVRFTGVPDKTCTIYFKGAVPGKFRPITWGTWHCHLESSTAVCVNQKEKP